MHSCTNTVVLPCICVLTPHAHFVIYRHIRLIFSTSRRLEKHFQDWQAKNSRPNAAKVHAFLSVAWLLGFSKLLRIAASTEEAINATHQTLAAVAALQLFACTFHGICSWQLFTNHTSGPSKSEQPRLLCVLSSILCNFLIQLLLGNPQFKIFFDMPCTFGGSLVSSWLVVLNQIRLSSSLLIFAINYIQYVMLKVIDVRTRESSSSVSGVASAFLFDMISFTASAVVLPILTSIVLEVS